MRQQTKVLVVDDDQPTRDLIVDVLEDEGYVVHATDTASHTLSAVETKHYDIILLDLRMPGIDGVELFHILYKRALVTMPIILMTADNKSLQELLAQGVKFILFKPFDLNTLLNCIAEALRSPRETQKQGTPVPVSQDSTTVPEDVHICA